MRTPEQIKQAKREWGQRDYITNREKYKLRAKLWRLANSERGYAISKRWRAKHREQYNAAQKKWRDDNPEKVKEIAHQTYRKHGAKYLEAVKKRLGIKAYRTRGLYHQTLRRARKKHLTVGDLTEIAKVYERARWWKQWFNIVVDHIIPLSRNGTHEAKNLQIIYGFENNRKYNNGNYKPKVVFL
jgi:hypothetical protein